MFSYPAYPTDVDEKADILCNIRLKKQMKRPFAVRTSGETQKKLSLRAHASSVVRKHRWLPPTVVLVFASLFAAAVVNGSHSYSIFASAGALILASYIWGYAVRACKVTNFPSLLNLPRRQYGDVWDALAATPGLARVAACGQEHETFLRRSAQTPVRNLIELVGVRAEDDVLEFGCGVARIGFQLAPLCRSWTGADISPNMLTAAAQRLQGVTNARLVKLQHIGLGPLESNAFDLVYSTNMLDHLDGMDRWRYVQEAFRVLRPEGRLFVDNTALEQDAGWAAFARGAESSQELERPPYAPVPSTAAELTTYASRAGFVQILAHKRSPLVIVTAVKPPLR